MSISTWKAEYYPTPASEVPAEEAVAHSLRKWRGFTEENLARHDVSKHFREIRDNETGEWLAIDAATCALCQHHHSEELGCVECPLLVSLGHPCDDVPQHAQVHVLSPYNSFLEQDNPHPMIEALEACLASPAK